MPRNLLSQRSLAYAVLTITMIIWASAFPAIRVVLQELSPMALTTARMLVAASGMALAALLLRTPAPKRRDLPWIFGCGLTGFAAYHLALNFGMVHVTAGQASLLVATTPIWTTALARRLLGEEVTWATVTSLVLGLLGVGVMVLRPEDMGIAPGAALILLAAAAAGANITLQKHLLARCHPIDTSIHVTIAGCLPFLLHAPWAASELGALSAHGWLWVVYLGLVPIGLGYFLSTYALSILPATRSAQVFLLVPPITAGIGWLWLSEPLSWRTLLGGAVILTGVLLGGRAESVDGEPARN